MGHEIAGFCFNLAAKEECTHYTGRNNKYGNSGLNILQSFVHNLSAFKTNTTITCFLPSFLPSLPDYLLYRMFGLFWSSQLRAAEHICRYWRKLKVFQARIVWNIQKLRNLSHRQRVEEFVRCSKLQWHGLLNFNRMRNEDRCEDAFQLGLQWFVWLVLIWCWLSADVDVAGGGGSFPRCCRTLGQLMMQWGWDMISDQWCSSPVSGHTCVSCQPVVWIILISDQPGEAADCAE